MYNPYREQIWATLFALLQTKLAASYTTMSRTHVQPPALNSELQPALFLVQAGESKKPGPPGLPGKVMLAGFIILYFQSPVPMLEDIGKETLNGATLLNTLLDGIDTALLPDNPLTKKLQLGGICEHCWIEGQTDMDTGVYGSQGAAIVPIRILVP